MLFDPFAQGEARYPGRISGMGLALARRYLQLNRATLTVESSPGKGSKFTIEFPSDCESSPMLRTMQRPALVVVSGTSQSEPETSPMALVIGGDGNSREEIRSLLEHRYAVRQANSTNDARATIGSYGLLLRVIVTDLSNGRLLDGLAMTRELRVDTSFDEVAIIAVMENATVEDRERAYAAGCDACIAKPVNPARFFSILDRLKSRGPIQPGRNA